MKEKLQMEWKKIAGLGGRKGIEYVWTYYKFFLLPALAVFFLIITGVTIYKNLSTDTILTLAVIDAVQDPKAFGELEKDILQAVQTDNGHSKIVIDTSASSVNTDENTAKITILMSVASDTDAVICNREVYDRFSGENIFEDWEALLGEEYGSYSQHMTDGILDLSKCPGWGTGKYTNYEPAYLCVLKKSGNKEKIKAILDCFTE